jgi:hypothetical protein
VPSRREGNQAIRFVFVGGRVVSWRGDGIKSSQTPSLHLMTLLAATRFISHIAISLDYRIQTTD